MMLSLACTTMMKQRYYEETIEECSRNPTRHRTARRTSRSKKGMVLSTTDHSTKRLFDVVGFILLLTISQIVPCIQGWSIITTSSPISSSIGSSSVPSYKTTTTTTTTKRTTSLTATVSSSSPSSSSSSSTTTTTLFEDDLKSKTVPELRQMIIDSGLNERGLQSKLKRKQDLIDFLVSIQQPQPQQNEEEEKTTVEDTTTMTTTTTTNDPNNSIPIGIELDDDDDDDMPTGLQSDQVTRSNGIKIDDQESRDDNDVVPTQQQEQTRKPILIDKVKKERNEKTSSPQHPTTTTTETATSSLLDIPQNILSKIPKTLQEQMIKRGIRSLLPSQILSFSRIQQGQDTILQAPTGSGKTMAYIVPLLSRCSTTLKRPQPQAKVALPVIIVVAPSRELCRQVGKEWTKLSSSLNIPVVTVFGGVPIERHINLLKSKPMIVVSTPGRLRELVREGHIDYKEVMVLVMDEADTLLDKSDSPDVTSIFNEIETSVGYRTNNQEYQLVLVSATINENVRDFTEDLMISPRAYLRVQGNDSKILVSSSSSLNRNTVTVDSSSGTVINNIGSSSSSSSAALVAPSVQHWHTSCKSNARPSITADLISVLSPRLAIIFVPTKSETESIASYLSSKLALFGDIRILHGDMSQTSRSRSISLIREASIAGISQVLVATDVASRGLDLPNVDLVIQFGIPRMAGKEGTFSTELYTHRSGRTGRVRMVGSFNQEEEEEEEEKTANAILLYDPAMGEGKVLTELVEEVHSKLKVRILPRPIPSAEEVVEAGYRRTRGTLGLGGHYPSRDSSNGSHPPPHLKKSELAQYFESRLEADDALDTTDPKQLLSCLAHAMAALSNLDTSLSPMHQQYSLLTGSDAYRTLRLTRQDGTRLSPPEVTKYCKGLGSGKLGRVMINEEDGSALFDLSPKKTQRLLDAVATEGGDVYILEQPTSL